MIKEIEDVKELEIGKLYYLYDKRTGKPEGLEEYRRMTDNPGNEGFDWYAFKGNIWTHEGNNQGMQRWHIFGPVAPSLFYP